MTDTTGLFSPGVVGLLLASEAAKRLGLAWMNSMRDRLAPSPIGYF